MLNTVRVILGASASPSSFVPMKGQRLERQLR